MYSPEARKLIESAGLSVGDRLRYSGHGRTAEGLLLPHADIGDPGCLVLKLDSGYNIGLKAQGAKIERMDGAGAKKGKTEKKSEPGEGASSPFPSPPSASPPRRPPLAILGTGGTIASRVDYKTGAVHPALSAEELLASYPRLAAFGPIRARSLFSILSEDMRPEFWTLMAEGAAAAFKDGAEGIVLTHGTDTMGYSAAALSYALDGLPGPVVFTGAQRSPDRGSSDAAQNLFCSAAAARAGFAAVAVCMHASSSDGLNLLHWGTRARKGHSSGRWAFRSVGLPPFGKVMADSGQVVLNEGEGRPPARDENRKLSVHAKFSDRVHLAWAYPGLKPATVSSWSEFDGVVLAATGLGHLPVDSGQPDSRHSVLPAIRELVSSGVLVALAPQALEGRLNLDVYSSGRLLQEAGVLGHGCDWLAETAYVKMCWALGQHQDHKKAAELMLAPKASDLAPRSRLSGGDEEEP